MVITVTLFRAGIISKSVKNFTYPTYRRDGKNKKYTLGNLNFLIILTEDPIIITVRQADFQSPGQALYKSHTNRRE